MAGGDVPGRAWGWRLAALVIVVGWACWPLDAPWINDEPHLILRALDANAAGEIPWVGLQSTRGTPYGPLGLWIDQLLLLVTHDIAWLVSLRALLFGACLAGTLAWLARALDVTRWLVVATLASPWMWFYARLHWDNSWLIPFAPATLAAYVGFLRTRRVHHLIATCVGGTLMVLCHLMCAPLLVGIALHALWTARRDLARHAVALTVTLAVLAIVSAPYWRAALAAPFAADPDGSLWRGLLYPLLAPTHLTGMGMPYLVGTDWLDAWPGLLRWPYFVCMALSFSVFAWCIAGAIDAVFERAEGAGAELRRSVARLGVLVIGLHCVLAGLTRTHGDPHHLNATWVAAAVVAWSTIATRVDRAPDRPRRLAQALALVLAIVTVLVAVRVHVTGGTRSLRYGPSLRTQVVAARLLARLPPDVPIESDVPHVRSFPHALRALARLEGRVGPPEPAAALVVRWSRDDPLDARLVAVPR